MTVKAKKSQTKPTNENSTDQEYAHKMLAPEIQAGITLRKWQDPTLAEKIGIQETVTALREQSSELKAGNMDRAEQMLLAQAHTLDELFNHLARRAQPQEYMSQFEAHLKLAFKAQNQCRMTLETLSNIKNPPVVYAKQANISNGPQQVNNGVVATHAAENQNPQNKLLKVNHGQTLDSIRAGETGGSNPEMATLETINRT